MTLGGWTLGDAGATVESESVVLGSRWPGTRSSSRWAGCQPSSRRTDASGSEVWVHLAGSPVMLDSGTGAQSLEGLRKVKQSPKPGKDRASGQDVGS